MRACRDLIYTYKHRLLQRANFIEGYSFAVMSCHVRVHIKRLKYAARLTPIKLYVSVGNDGLGRGGRSSFCRRRHACDFCCRGA